MPSEDIPTAATEDEGPRHAVPRKSLLRRLHMPVGKAIALAAMPSAALLGMGFTSPLAKASQQPENPFQDGPCVEVPDAEVPEEEAAAQEQSQEPAEDASSEPEPEESEEDEAAQDEPAEPQETEQAERPEEAQEPAAETEAEAQTEAETEAAEEEPNPLDPLGIGDGLEAIGEGLGDLLTPGDEEDEDQGGDTGDSGDAEAPAEPQEPEESEEPAASEETADEERAAEDEEPETPPEEETDPGTEESEPQETETEDPFAPDAEGREPFPCPVEELVAGTDEQTPLPLPNEPWYLEATYLTLRGLSYHGVVNVTTADGTVKQVLKFTAEKVDIGDLHQIVDGPNGVRHHVATDPGSNSTFRGGTVTMYTERLEGNLFGVIPIVFDAEHQPPLDLPVVHFTDVFVTQAGQFGGNLTMQGMDLYTTSDGPTVPAAP
ncbi:hypothetical protein [Streptomyces litchfieldiae]|uniref:Uncharacterized protein n=1 Tax=Streptomyces litchfieldiae TaxID=3075543 RepID=A0ABU2MIF1_9ACTN|nr:hypothetical protein [Streptomyces sp. DSM 44938]MDT0341372.1 hypothetical protein [Streptomyces sp. DSM 44938]